MSSPKAKWEKFFRSCGLPTNVSTKYSVKFVKERIQPYMLKDLQKEDLAQLSIDAIGDQLAILKHIRENFNSSSAAKSKMDYDDVEEEDVEMTEVKLSRAPDRHEVYKIQMPEGKTQKTRSILEKQEELRMKGLVKRGTTGTRISGFDVRKPKTLSARISESSKVIKKPIMSEDISSTTKLIHSKMRSDQIIAKEAIKTGAGGGNMLQRALVSTIEDSDNTNFRVRLNIPTAKNAPTTSRTIPASSNKFIATSKFIPATSKVIYVTEATPARRAKPKPIVQRIVRQLPITERLQVVAPVKFSASRVTYPGQGKRIAPSYSRPKSIADRLSVV